MKISRLPIATQVYIRIKYYPMYWSYDHGRENLSVINSVQDICDEFSQAQGA